MSNKNLESTELRQDTTMKQTEALKTRIKFFQEQQSSKVPGIFLDIVSKGVMFVANVGKKIAKVIPEETQKKGLEIYQKIILSF
ncbi:MAG: hypothetical protein EU530_01445 [Promethearchaeota archaeon]|nr:MAG: hypothetical protein EU530_01445 [Candidatus Lokiarchaeota archaeon]